LPDTSVGNHHFLLRNSAEDCSSHLLRCWSPKSCKIAICLYYCRS
jgi:hypothetical protein